MYIYDTCVRGFFLCLYVLWLCVLTAHHERGTQPRMNDAGLSEAVKFEQCGGACMFCGCVYVLGLTAHHQRHVRMTRPLSAVKFEPN